ncbi:hypothetical protein BI364_14840 [Acidihalobacter yilgarnensis]|uniref:Uncharacterized protein n=1 Tax=Acidihalobacter yilgarnensis TaxID=2819280 RepID=A0A1D8IRM0_9GAMM|nr:hypothetical protein [Acidihalobacter yilgarnensis]AOU99047.1 hypothetical protein BI364_14840 [Acidihalobacter yilgarnensis]
MRIVKQDKKSVTVTLNASKAQDLLDGLLAHPELGDLATDLSAKLQAAGVEPQPSDAPIRYEHAPPLQH